MTPSLSHQPSTEMDNGYASDSDATVEQDWSAMFGMPRASTASASLQVPNGSTCAGDEEVGGANNPTSKALFCLCQLPEDDRPYIGCDGGCNRWFHYSCLGLLQQDVDLIGEYICRECQHLNASDGLETNEAAGVNIPGPASVTDHDPVVEEYPFEPLLEPLSPSSTYYHSSLNASEERNGRSGLRLGFLEAMEREYRLLMQPTEGFRAWQHQASLNALRQLRTPAGLAMGDASWRNKCELVQFWLDFEKQLQAIPEWLYTRSTFANELNRFDQQLQNRIMTFRENLHLDHQNDSNTQEKDSRILQEYFDKLVAQVQACPPYKTSVRAKHLVRPAGRINAKIHLNLHYPSFKTGQGVKEDVWGTVLDASNPSLRLTIEKGGLDVSQSILITDSIPCRIKPPTYETRNFTEARLRGTRLDDHIRRHCGPLLDDFDQFQSRISKTQNEQRQVVYIFGTANHKRFLSNLPGTAKEIFNMAANSSTTVGRIWATIDEGGNLVQMFFLVAHPESFLGGRARLRDALVTDWLWNLGFWLAGEIGHIQIHELTYKCLAGVLRYREKHEWGEIMRVIETYMNWTLSQNPLRSMVEEELKKYLPSELQAARFADQYEQRSKRLMQGQKYRQKPGVRERQAARIQEYYRRPGYREKMKERARAYRQQPEVRERLRQAKQAYFQRVKESIRGKNRARQQAYRQQPEWLERHRAYQKTSYERRRRQPENLEKERLKARERLRARKERLSPEDLEKLRQKNREAQLAYRQRQKIKKRDEPYRQQELEKRREYARRPEVKAREKEYRERPEVKARRKEYRERPEVKARIKEYALRGRTKQKERENYTTSAVRENNPA